MDSVACNKVQPVVRKVKKKQVKGELDHLKRAEKKKRRLEKALATSAAIRSELEKKKQKKKEEQQRLDEEGAAVAEAVALHVLLGEDSDDSCKFVLNKGGGPWGYEDNIDIFMAKDQRCIPHQGHARHSLERSGYGTGCRWEDMENTNRLFSYGTGTLGRDMQSPYFEDSGWGSAEFSAGLIAAQAVSSLQIGEDAQDGSIIFNGC